MIFRRIVLVGLVLGAVACRSNAVPSPAESSEDGGAPGSGWQPGTQTLPDGGVVNNAAERGPVQNRFSVPGTISASSQASSAQSPVKAADADLNSLWRAAAADPAPWLQMDFGEPFTLTRVEQTFEASSTWFFRIDGSLDGSNWATLMDRSKGASGRTFSDGVVGQYRYVRLVFTQLKPGQSAASRELVVVGEKGKTNLALRKPATASSFIPADPEGVAFPPGAASDGNTGTYWAASSGSLPQWVTVDLQAPTAITGVAQLFKDFGTYGFRIEGSLDNASWSVLLDGTTGLKGLEFRREVSGTFRYIRMTVLSTERGFWANSVELSVFGEDPEPADARTLSTGVKAVSTSLVAGSEPFNAVDGNLATAWRAQGSAAPQSLTLDLGNVSLIKRVEQTFATNELWKFALEASANGTNWVTVLDQTAGVSGQKFGADMSGVFRFIRLTVTPTSANQAVTSQELRVLGMGSPLSQRWWQRGSSVMRYFPVWQKMKLTEITAKLDELQAQGFQALELAPVFQGNRDVWAGLAVTNLYAIQPDIGTMQDFKDLLAAAHARDMKIIFFANPGYAHTTAPFFQTALNNPASPERQWFDIRGTTNPDVNNPEWRRHPTGVYFFGKWDKDAPSFNFSNAAWRAECQKYLRFWMDTGVDGMILDAPVVYHYNDVNRNNEAITNVLRNYDTFSNAEGDGRPFLIKDWHYTALQDYTITQWGVPPNQGYSRILQAVDGPTVVENGVTFQTVPRIEDLFKGARDKYNAMGGISQTPPNWGRAKYPVPGRLLEIATLTTAGTLFYLHNDYYTILPQEQEIPFWTEQQRQTLYQLIRAHGSHDALANNGLRTRVRTNDDLRFYAFKRMNAAGTASALVVLNFQASAQEITLDLTGTGIEVGQTPIDLLTDAPVTPITAATYRVQLPAYGFAVLGVNSLAH